MRDFPLVPDAEAVAVASRSIDRAKAFAAEHDIARAHGSYRDIVDDPDVDVLYIATPHPQHRAVALAALRAGKAIMVEKAFTVTPQATREIVACRAETGVFAMEAMWTRFQPAVVRMRELLADGAIGEVRAVQVDLASATRSTRATGSSPPELGGGALFDLTVYPISFAQMVLGDPTAVSAHGAVTADGVDLEESRPAPSRPRHRHAAPRRCAARRPARRGCSAPRAGSTSSPRFHHPDTIVLHRDGREPEEITRPHVGGGYFHELVEVTECVAAGRPESTVMPLADTVAVQDAMGEVAAQLGMDPQEGAGRAVDEHEWLSERQMHRAVSLRRALQGVGRGAVHAAVEALAGPAAEHRRDERAEHRERRRGCATRHLVRTPPAGRAAGPG